MSQSYDFQQFRIMHLIINITETEQFTNEDFHSINNADYAYLLSQCSTLSRASFIT